MNHFLDDFFDLAATSEQRQASRILNDVRISRETVNDLSKLLDGIDITGSVNTSGVGGTIEYSQIDSNYRTIRRAIEELYTINNHISLMLQKTEELTNTEIVAIQENITAIQRKVKSHNFLIGNHTGFGYSSSDTFDSDINQDKIPTSEDRAVAPFGPSHMAGIDTEEKCIALPSSNMAAFNLKLHPRMVKSNVQDGIRSDFPGFNQSANPGVHPPDRNAWRVIAEVDAPIQTSLPEAEGTVGAQAVVEYKLPSSEPASEISISPFADIPVQLVQATIFTDDEDLEGRNLLESPMSLDARRTINFPMQSISKLRLVLNQPTYNRSSTMWTREDEYKKAYDALKERLKRIEQEYKVPTPETANHILFLILGIIKENDAFPLYGPNDKQRSKTKENIIVPRPLDGRSGINDLVSKIHKAVQPTTPAYNQEIGSVRNNYADFDLVTFYESLLLRFDPAYRALVIKEVEEFRNSGPFKDLYDPEGILSPLEKLFADGWVYRYAIGLKSVNIGVRSNEFRGVYISKPLQANGDIGEISIMVDDWNYRAIEKGLDNSLLTSTEYSVSKVSNPVRESDWIPITPHNQTIVESERLYLNDVDKAMFRFPASMDASIVFYLNGRRIEVASEDLINSTLTEAVTGVNLASKNLSPDDIITVSYHPSSSFHLINFASYGFDMSPITNASDEHGSGQTFMSTGGGRTITLKNYPYVDQRKVGDSFFSEEFGMMGYTPINIMMADGSPVFNVTNYETLQSSTMPVDGYYYRHSGNNITFNRPIEQRFTVFYQYSQSNVRFRAVLRCNDKDLVSPKVRGVQIKGKIIRPDSRGLT